MKVRDILTLCLLVLFLPFVFIKAQSTNPDANRALNVGDISSVISLVATPETPGPNENVSIFIDGSGIDLDLATITWKINGQVVQSGQGVKSFNFITGGLGTETVVSATIDSGEDTYTRNATFTSNDIDILWQGKSYTPPFYKGKSLWPYQGNITLLAIPHVHNSSGQEISPNNLIYIWKQNSTVLGDVSGFGKNSLTFSDSILSLNQVIKVDVLTNKDTIVASKVINLNPLPPKILVYENNPLYGIIFNHESTGAISLQSKEISFIATPLFFSTANRNDPNIQYEWRVNNKKVSQSNGQITFRIPENVSGESGVGSSIKNIDKITQTSQKTFQVHFDNQISL